MHDYLIDFALSRCHSKYKNLGVNNGWLLKISISGFQFVLDADYKWFLRILLLAIILFSNAIVHSTENQMKLSTYMAPDDEFEISYPMGWDVLDLDRIDSLPDSLQDRYADEIDKLKSYQKQQLDSKMSIVFAYPGEHFVNNINIVISPEKYEKVKKKDINELSTMLPDYLSENFGIYPQDLTVKVENIADYQCLVMRYKTGMSVEYGVIPVFTDQYQLNTKQRGFTITFTSAGLDYPPISVIQERIVASLIDKSPKKPFHIPFNRTALYFGIGMGIVLISIRLKNNTPHASYKPLTGQMEKIPTSNEGGSKDTKKSNISDSDTDRIDKKVEFNGKCLKCGKEIVNPDINGFCMSCTFEGTELKKGSIDSEDNQETSEERFKRLAKLDFDNSNYTDEDIASIDTSTSFGRILFANTMFVIAVIGYIVLALYICMDIFRVQPDSFLSNFFVLIGFSIGSAVGNRISLAIIPRRFWALGKARYNKICLWTLLPGFLSFILFVILSSYIELNEEPLKLLVYLLLLSLIIIVPINALLLKLFDPKLKLRYQEYYRDWILSASKVEAIDNNTQNLSL